MASGGGEVQWRQDCQAAGEHFFFKGNWILSNFPDWFLLGAYLWGTELSANFPTYQFRVSSIVFWKELTQSTQQLRLRLVVVWKISQIIFHFTGWQQMWSWWSKEGGRAGGEGLGRKVLNFFLCFSQSLCIFWFTFPDTICTHSLLCSILCCQVQHDLRWDECEGQHRGGAGDRTHLQNYLFLIWLILNGVGHI